VSYEILERNIDALLRQSYRPALPTPLFRDRLRARFLSELERRRRPRRVGPRLALALAAALVLLLAALRFLAPGAPATRAELVASGAVALGFPDGTWRAADEEELFHGLQVEPPALTVVTPEARGLDLLVAAGRVALGTASELELFLEPAPPRARLVAGHAEFQHAAGRCPLVRGEVLVLTAPLPELVESGPAPAARQDLAPSTGPGSVTPTTAVAPRTVRGRVVRAADGEPLHSFTVGLLRERIGNATYPPVTRTFESADGSFEWRDTPAGQQRVFVHAAGFALAALGEHDLERGIELEARLEEGFTLEGRVQDGEGRPLLGALVVAEDEVPTDGLFFAGAQDTYWLPVQAVSGPDGRFTLRQVGPGAHVLRASLAGHAPTWKTLAQPGSEHVLTLPRGGTLVGRVTGADGGPLAQAEIVVVAMDQPSLPRTNFALARTDLEGRYRLEHLPPMTMIAVLIRGDRPDVRPLQMLEGAEVQVDFATPLSGLRLSGRLLDEEGRPLGLQNLGLFDRKEATWNSEWIASTTDREGRYLFEGLEPGDYLVFLIDELGRGLRCVDGLTLSDELFAHEHDIRVPHGQLEVRLRAAQGGVPVEGVALVLEYLEPSGGEHFSGLGLSGADGSFRFVQQRPGEYRLSAYPTDGRHGYRSGTRVTLGDEPVALALELPPGGSATLRVRARDGRPLARARVQFVAADGLAHNFSQVPETDAEGLFHAVGLVPGDYRVRVTQAGHRTLEQPFHFELGSAAVLELTLDPDSPAPR